MAGEMTTQEVVTEADGEGCGEGDCDATTLAAV